MKRIMKIKERELKGYSQVKMFPSIPLGIHHEDTKVPACQDEQRESPHAGVTKEYET